MLSLCVIWMIYFAGMYSFALLQRSPLRSWPHVADGGRQPAPFFQRENHSRADVLLSSHCPVIKALARVTKDVRSTAGHDVGVVETKPPDLAPSWTIVNARLRSLLSSHVLYLALVVDTPSVLQSLLLKYVYVELFVHVLVIKTKRAANGPKWNL